MRGAIEVLIGTGLGNQMFRYAMGRSLSLRLQRPLVLDISLLSLHPDWGFDLRHFRLGREQVRNWPVLPWRVRRKLLRALTSLGIEVLRWVEEPGLHFSPEILAMNKPCILNGFWQSERYFDSITDQLREDFTIVAAQDARSAECERCIRRVKSIGLHVRRGDYVTEPKIAASHGTRPKEYYDQALELILSRMGTDAELFVFSDDMEWARANILHSLPITYVDWNAKRNYEDMRLMSACQALVIANSTFSWWAGWLNPRPDKLVVAPRQWYRAPGMVSDLPSSRWLIAL